VSAYQLTAPEVSSLALAGIKTVQDLNPAGPSATFDAAAGSIAVSLNTNVAIVATTGSDDKALYTATNPTYPIESQLADTFGMQTSNFNSACYSYVVLGVGSESDLTNRTISSAPVHFSSTGQGPDQEYGRFAAIFAVQKATAAAGAGPAPGAVACPITIQPAKFVGAVQIDLAGHLFGLSHSLGHTYSDITAANQ
jgi:hypothetical protein